MISGRCVASSKFVCLHHRPWSPRCQPWSPQPALRDDEWQVRLGEADGEEERPAGGQGLQPEHRLVGKRRVGEGGIRLVRPAPRVQQRLSTLAAAIAEGHAGRRLRSIGLQPLANAFGAPARHRPRGRIVMVAMADVEDLTQRLGVVAGRHEGLRQGGHRRAGRAVAEEGAHVVDTQGLRPAPGEEGVARRRAHRLLGIGVGEGRAAGGERVDCRCLGAANE